MPRQYRTFTIEDYEITKDGVVINKHSGRIVKLQKNGKGYLRFSLGGKLCFVHRIVAEMYVPNPQNKPQVNHKDGNKLNNSADNLEWVTNQENRSHAVHNGLHKCGENVPWSKLTSNQVKFIRSHPEISNMELATLFGVSRATIRDVRKFKSWKNEKIC